MAAAKSSPTLVPFFGLPAFTQENIPFYTTISQHSSMVEKNKILDFFRDVAHLNRGKSRILDMNTNVRFVEN